MKRNEIQWYRGFKLSALLMTGFTALLVGVSPKQAEAVNLGGATHIGTFEGQTTFQTSSSNGINPGLYLEVMDRYGNYKTYTSEDGVITVDGTKEGAYVTQAKLLGKTKYRDVQTGELLDQWEDGRDLKLESVKMPVLTTTGKNLSPVNTYKLVCDYGELTNSMPGTAIVNNIKVKPNTKYVLTYNKVEGVPDNKSIKIMTLRDKVNNPYSHVDVYTHPNRITEYEAWDGVIITTESDAQYITITTGSFNASSNKIVIDNIQLEEYDTPTPYEPYQSNILTVNEEVELRGIGEVKDELNLLTGEVVENFINITLNGDGTENTLPVSIMDNVIRFSVRKQFGLKPQGAILCNKFTTDGTNGDYEHIRVDASTPNGYIQIYINKTRINYIDGDSNSLINNKFLNWLQQNNIHIIAELSEKSIKTVDLTSTYTFGTVAMRDVYVDGKVKPLLCSVNVPTENLTFVLDPNQEEEKQFIAPTFRLINETPTSVRVSLTAFKQESNVFNDVSPTKYENWSQLNKEQSRDIALALVPLASDNWVTVDETPRYVNNYSASVLGEIKAKSSVDLTFKALHGQAFTEELNPQYRLVFLFDF